MADDHAYGKPGEFPGSGGESGNSGGAGGENTGADHSTDGMGGSEGGGGLLGLGGTVVGLDLGGGDHVNAGGNGIDATVGSDHVGVAGSDGILNVDLGSGDHVTLDNTGLTADLGGSDTHVPLDLGSVGDLGSLGNLGDIANLGNLLGGSEPLVSVDAGNNGIDASVAGTDAHVGLDGIGSTGGITDGLLGGTGLGDVGGILGDGSPLVSVDADNSGVDATVANNDAHVGLADLSGGDGLLGGLLGGAGDQSFSPDATAAISANADAPVDTGDIPHLDTGSIDSLSPNVDVHVSDLSGGDLVHVTGV